MKLFVLTSALLFALAPCFAPMAYAQSDAPSDRRGTNYDPPPPPTPKPAQPPTAEPETELPSLELQKPDWSDKATWVKFGLFIGSIVLARRAFRQMKEPDVIDIDDPADEP